MEKNMHFKEELHHDHWSGIRQPGEIETLLTDETRTPIRTEAGVSFYQIRPHIIACCCGVSKVNAAMGAQLLISLYHPDLVLNAGVAGCFENVPIGTIVLAEGFVQHDVDTTAIGGPRGAGVHRQTDSVPHGGPACRQGRHGCHRSPLIAPAGWPPATGSPPIPPRSHWIADTFHPLLCEMEGLCRGTGVPAERGEVHGHQVRIGLPV